jgi:hypothetical protein
MRKKNKLVFIYIIAVVVLALVGLYIINHKTAQTSTDIQASQTASSQAIAIEGQASQSASKTVGASATATDPNLYTNTKYGFSISLKDGWSGYSAVSSANRPDWAQEEVDFTIKASDGKTYTPLMVYIVDISSYSESLATSVHATKITQGTKYVYLYSTWEQTPSSLIALTDKSIANTIKTFKLQ